MNVLIVDDEALARDELRYLVEQNRDIDEVYEVDSSDDARQVIAQHQIDLMFLDIQLGSENGFDLAKELKLVPNAPKIVFATAYDEYALEAFNTKALDYILKPLEQDRVNEAIYKVKEVLHPRLTSAQIQAQNPRISIAEEERVSIILKKEIIYANVIDGDLMVATPRKTFVTKMTLIKLQESLDPRQFMQVHRSYLINLNAVSSVEPSFNHTYELTMINGDKVPVSRSFVPAMKTALDM